MADQVLQVILRGIDDGAISTLSSVLSNVVGLGDSMTDMAAKAEAAAAKSSLLETKAAAAAMSAQNLGVRAEQAAAQADAFAVKAAAAGAGGEAFGLKAQAAAARAQDLGVRAYAAGGQAEYLGTKAAAAATEADALAASVEKASGKLAAFGPAGMVAAAGVVALGAALVDAGKQAAAFEQQLQQATANTTLTAQDTKAMGDAILQMSTESGASLSSLGAGFVHVANVMGDASTAAGVLSVAQQSAVATGGDVSSYAQTLARVLHEFGMSAGEASTAMDTLHTAAAAGDLTLEQFTANSGNALAMAANYKVPLDQVSAAYIALTKHGMDAADANTQIADQFLRLTTVTPKVEAELKRVSQATGVDLVGDFTSAGLASKGLTGIYADLTDAEAKMGMTSEQAFAENMLLGDSLRGGRGLAILAGNGMSDYTSILAQVDNTTAAATKRQDDYNNYLNTTAGQAAIAKANLGELAVVIGGPVNEAAQNLLATFNDVFKQFQTFDALVAEAGQVGNMWADDVKNALTPFDNWINALVGADDHTKDLTKDTDALGQKINDLGTFLTNAGGGLNSWLDQVPALKSVDTWLTNITDQAHLAVAAANDVGAVGAKNATSYDQSSLAKDYGASASGMSDPSAWFAKAGATIVSTKAEIKTAFDQALADAKTFYGDQKQTALDAAAAEKDGAISAAQATLDATKASIDGEKTAYDDRAKADITARQDQTKAALQSLADQNTAANVAAATANTAAGAAAAAANTRAGAIAAAANTAANVQGAAEQKAADESDARWKAQVASIKAASDASENALHTSNDAILKSDVDTANDAYNAQITAIDAEVKAREEGDARAIHSREQATTAAIRNIDAEKTAALRAVDEETAAYTAQEADKLKAISATASAQVQALNDQLADEKRANTERLDIERMTKASGAAAGQALGSYFTATDAQIADTEAALAAKQAGNQALAAEDTAAAAVQAAKAQALSDQLSAINQATADQMAAYKIQTDSTITADNVAAVTQQATDQKTALAQQLSDFKQTEADKKQAINDSAAAQKATLTQELTDYKYTMAQNLQAFKDAEAEKKREDKATLDATLTNIATWQAQENARHTDALAKIAEKAKADTAAIDLLAQQRKDAYTAETARRAADYTAANVARQADYAAATAQRQADYTAATAARAADYKDSTEKINANSAHDIATMQANQKTADLAFADRTKAADAHFKDQQGQIDLTYKQDANAIAETWKQEIAALDGRKSHMDDYTTAVDLSWQKLIGDAQAYTAAINGQASAMDAAKAAAGRGMQTGTGNAGGTGAGQGAQVAYAPPGPDGHDTARGLAAFARAENYVGVNKGTYYRDGETWCEQFAEDMTGLPNMGGSARQAWDNWGGKQLPNQIFNGPDLLYFSGPTAAGHVMVGNGDQGVSVLDPKYGISEYSVGAFLANNPGASFLGSVPLYASGTDWHPGGQAIVGERGPELLTLPRGSSVTPNGQYGGIDYDRLAEAVIRGLNGLSITMDRQQLGALMRTDNRAYAASSPAYGVGGR